MSGRLATRAALPVVVDRRLDPDAPISLDCSDEPLREVVGRVASQAGGEPAVLASSVRIVPAGMADLLVRAEGARDARIAKLPPAQRTILAVRRPWSWPAGTPPAELVAAVVAQAGISLDGAAALPHDHLPETAWPPLSLAERLDLLLADYDRRIDWRPGEDGRPAGRIVALDAGLPSPETSLSAERPAPPRRPPAKKAEIKKPQPKKPAGTRPAGGRETFTLQVTAPLDQVLTVVAKRLGLALEIDTESLRRRGVAAGEIVKATVKDASRDELLDAILAPVGLAWKIDADTLRVSGDAAE